MRKLIPVFLLLTAAACTPSPAPAPSPPDVLDAAKPACTPSPCVDGASPTPPAPEAAPPAPPTPTDACAAGEAKLLALGCKDARGRLIGGPDLHGVGWAIQCRVDADAGVDLHAICIAAASSCAAVMQCK